MNDTLQSITSGRGNVCTLVGKGPTAAHVDQFLDACPESAVCVINDAAKLISGERSIDFGFFTDIEMIEAARPTWERVREWRCPSMLHAAGEPVDGLTIRDVDGFPVDRVREYPHELFAGGPDDLRDAVRRGVVAHHSTATAAHSWLAMFGGFDRIRLIGIDGGKGYAGGLAGVGYADFTLWRAVHENLCDVLSTELAVESEWFCDG